MNDAKTEQPSVRTEPLPRPTTRPRLPRAGAQIPPVDLRRPDRPGRRWCARSRTRSRPAASRRPGSSPACAASARPRPRASSPARSITSCPTARSTGPTIAMPELGVHCQAIMESRHIDVIEMDAASHNGVDDVRQINDAIRYAPVSARYKVYILDEVHMLSPRGVQRAAEDAGRAAAARQVHLRHHRNPQGAGDGAVALPALRPAPRRCRRCW